MNYLLKLTSCLLCFVLAGTTISFAQTTDLESPEEAYTRVITQRAAKIVAVLNISDTAKATRVRDVIVEQYRNLSRVHDGSEGRIKAVRKQFDKDKAAIRIKAIENDRDSRLYQFHAAYLSKLAAELSHEQVVKIKDGMTYNVLPITYKGYLDMLPNLTDRQKTQIMAALIEAREHAIDAGSSEGKHAWFGKYKGRINNLLSAQGYDLKKESEAWHKRLEAAKNKKQ